MDTKSGAREKHILGGRTFLTITDSTVEQDFHFLALTSRAHIDKITLQPDESPEAFGRRLLELTVKSGLVLELLGCLLVPQQDTVTGAEPGEAWTREIGEATAIFLGQLKAGLAPFLHVDQLVEDLLEQHGPSIANPHASLLARAGQETGEDIPHVDPHLVHAVLREDLDLR